MRQEGKQGGIPARGCAGSRPACRLLSALEALWNKVSLSVLSTVPTRCVAGVKPASGKPRGCRPALHPFGPWIRRKRNRLAETAPAHEIMR